MGGQKVQNLLGPVVGLGLTLPAFYSGQAGPPDWQPRGGGVQGLEALERNGRAYCPKPARGPQRQAGFSSQLPNRLAIFLAWESGGTDPSALGLGCCWGWGGVS